MTRVIRVLARILVGLMVAVAILNVAAGLAMVGGPWITLLVLGIGVAVWIRHRR